MISFTPKDINESLYWAEGIVDIYWQFNEDGTPNFEKTLFNLADVVWSTTEDELKEHMNKEKIEKMKSNPKNIQLTNKQIKIMLRIIFLVGLPQPPSFFESFY